MELAAVLTSLLVLGFVLYPVMEQDKRGGRDACLSNVKVQALGFVMYANDYDDHLPPATHWMDDVTQYKADDRFLHCPHLPNHTPDQFGYAMRRQLSGASRSKTKEPETEPLNFDSNLLMRNASTDLVGDPEFTRQRYVNVGYLDGHARALVRGQGAG